MSEPTISWATFMNEEQAALKKAVSMGLRNYLAQCVIEMTPEKEVELQKLADQMSPEISTDESVVLKKFMVDRLKAGMDPSPQTPEEEAELQKALDAEQLENQKKFSKTEKNEIKTEVKTDEVVVPSVQTPKWKVVK